MTPASFDPRGMSLQHAQAVIEDYAPETEYRPDHERHIAAVWLNYRLGKCAEPTLPKFAPLRAEALHIRQRIDRALERR